MINPAEISHHFSNVSQSPERRARLEVSSLEARLTDIRETAARLSALPDALPIPPEVVENLAGRHTTATRAYWAAESRCASWFVVGPSGFPFERNRKRTQTADRRMAEVGQHLKAAKRRLERIAFPHGMSDAIRSADPDALDKLRAKLAGREADQAFMTAANKVVRAFWKGGCRDADSGEIWGRYVAALRDIRHGITEGSALRLIKPDCMGCIGFASYSLTNNSSEIRRIKDRIAGLERMRSRGTVTAETAVEGVQLVENAEAARVQLVFPGKPDDATRSLLKANGFRWAPSEGAWQRHLNESGRWAAQRVLAKLAEAA